MHKHLRLALATAGAAALTGGLLTFGAGTATAVDSTARSQADFNGDGVGDVAFSAAGAYVSGKKNAGQLVVLYGTSTGVSSAKRSVISQNTAGNPGTAETGDYFGSETAYGDFNNDGYDDIAVSSPGEDVGSDTDAGGLVVLWGSVKGITGGGVTVPDAAPSGHDYWGKNLAAGDYDGDGKDDLVVGTTSATLYVYRGGFAKTGGGAPGIGRTTIKPPIQAGNGANGPHNLTAGDINGDGRTDLVVDGFEKETAYGWATNYYFPGLSTGLSSSSYKTLKPGTITAIGDIDHDGYGDIVSGAYWNTTTGDGTAIPDSSNGGRVNVTRGTASGPGTTTSINQNTGNVPGSAEKNDQFGYELDLGDVNGDGYLDLVVGTPGEDLADVTDTGALTVLYGSAGGLNTASGAQLFAQSSAGVPGADEKNDRLGSDVKLDDVNGDGRADLLAGSYENGGDGAVLYLPSNGTKITPSGGRVVSPGASGLSLTGTPSFGANFAD